MNIKTALVTGASKGIGEAISALLVERGIEVYGIGRDFTKTAPSLIKDPLFHGVTCDLTNDKETEVCVNFIRKQASIDMLVNNAGCAYYGLHEQLKADGIREMIKTNLELPIVLTGRFLPDFKKRGGLIINISSVTGSSFANPHGAAYGATKAGLLSFGRSIFEEARKCGVMVTSIMPDMTRTELYRNADFEADSEEGTGLDPIDVARMVGVVLDLPDGVTLPEITIRPQKHRIRKKQ
ncbi:SDR family oxidoreductase [Butyrivibrio sp. MC2013]|uniref:SDR family oxidoreductase n=1 Tax=Butyrivibrio sp. MC2013 TaxID=1280686 RepID=UPI0003FC8E76|nr:SDR family oxidoreductase [Butyrivibrio sp. MC2013]